MVIAALLAGCDGSHDENVRAPDQVVVARPKAATVTRYLSETGTTKAVASVDLVARVSGTLKSIDYQDGTEVKAGQRLFLIEPDLYQAQVQQAEAGVGQAHATVDNAQRQFDRQDKLSRSSVTSLSDLDTARATMDTSKAQLESAGASLAQAKLNLSYTNVCAPFDGFVTEHQADVGSLVGAGGTTTLATIIQLDPMQVSFSISDTDMLEIRKQMRDRGMTLKDIGTIPVEIGTQIDSGYPYKGRLDYAAPQTASGTGTLSARAILDNHDRALLPGLFVRIRIPVETVKNAFLVPPSAIGTDQEGSFVLAVNDHGVVDRRSVTLLASSGDLQQVQGLSAADWVVQNVLSGPHAGDAVVKRELSPQATASNETPR